MKKKTPWRVYILRCADGTLYTGVARDAASRLAQHNGIDRGGAKYTRARRPVCLVYEEGAASRSRAQKREAAIKKLPRREKAGLVGIFTRGKK